MLILETVARNTWSATSSLLVLKTESTLFIEKSMLMELATLGENIHPALKFHKSVKLISAVSLVVHADDS